MNKVYFIVGEDFYIENEQNRVVHESKIKFSRNLPCVVPDKGEIMNFQTRYIKEILLSFVMAYFAVYPDRTKTELASWILSDLLGVEELAGIGEINEKLLTVTIANKIVDAIIEHIAGDSLYYSCKVIDRIFDMTDPEEAKVFIVLEIK